MKKNLTQKKGILQTPHTPIPVPQQKWQTGQYERFASYSFVLPYQFLLLCRIMDITPRAAIIDFMDCLAAEAGQSHSGREQLINYFLERGYGQPLYSQQDIRCMFREMDAMNALYPDGGKPKLLNLYAQWRSRQHAYWFRKWFKKNARKP